MFYNEWPLVVKKFRRCKPKIGLQREVIRCKLYNDRLQRHDNSCKFLQQLNCRCKYLQRVTTRCKSNFYNDLLLVVSLQRVFGCCKHRFTTTHFFYIERLHVVNNSFTTCRLFYNDWCLVVNNFFYNDWVLVVKKLSYTYVDKNHLKCLSPQLF